MEATKTNAWRYIYIAAIILLLCLWLHQCQQTSTAYDRAARNERILNDSVKHYKNAIGTLTASVETLQFESKQMNEFLKTKDAQLTALTKSFSEIKFAAQYNSKITIPKVGIAFDKPITAIPTDSTCSEYTLVLPEPGAYFGEWFNFGYKVMPDSLEIGPFNTWTKTTLIQGKKRNWFLGPTKIVTEVTNDNPFIEVDELVGAELVYEEEWYRKWWVWLLTGITIGGTVNSLTR